jgi:hypothetical protein
MDSEREIEKWNARWMIVAGRAVCTGCLESQALEDCESPFFLMPVRTRLAVNKPSIRGGRFTTCSSAPEGELPVRL